MFEKGTSVSLSSFEIGRQARQERSLARSACVRGAGHALARGLRLLRSRGIRLVRDLVTQRLLRRAMRELYRLDDRTLADMGLTRGEIEAAARYGVPLRQQSWNSARHPR
jgi:uncharacterized protein YjiS (DUF1127 family)